MTALDTKYAEKMLKNIENPFWKDVLTAYIKTKEKIEFREDNVLKIPVFYNNNICIDKIYVFWKDWYKKRH